MLSRILPKMTGFFGLFSRHATLCVEGAVLLRDPSQAETGYPRIHAVEHQANRICQETMEMLHSSFITPIDRSDIHLLSSRIDDIMDHIEATAQRIWLYEIERPTPEMLEMSGNVCGRPRR